MATAECELETDDCKKKNVTMCHSKYTAIFLFLALSTLIFLLRKINILELSFRLKINSTIVPNGSSLLHHNHSYCNYWSQRVSPEEALEERSLFDSIAWPEPPHLSTPPLLNKTSDPAHSRFTILPAEGGREWHVGDQLEAVIQMFDFLGHPKHYGGDFIIARLHNAKLFAGVAGQVVDHLNGSYSVFFPLLWEGSAQVEVTLVHPSEAVAVLSRIIWEKPDRHFYQSIFRSGSVSETTVCNICLLPVQIPICNFTDPYTGEPWFCYKPTRLSCDTRVSHMIGGLSKTNIVTQEEEQLFRGGVNVKVHIPASGSDSVNVLPERKEKQDSSDNVIKRQLLELLHRQLIVEELPGHHDITHGDFTGMDHTYQPQMKSSSVKPGPSGYYYQDVWRNLGGITVRQFNNAFAISECLKDKLVYMYGDSTARQWLVYLNTVLPELKEIDLHTVHKAYAMAVDSIRNTMVTYRCHGPPLSYPIVPTSELHYVANELDRLAGGSNTVVVIAVWAHFGPFPTEVYINRLRNIRKAVKRLLDRAPGTLVVIRSGNVQAQRGDRPLNYSDWYSFQRDKVLRAMFKGLNVRLVNAWDMTVSHRLPHDIHPPPIIVKNMIDVLLSYIC